MHRIIGLLHLCLFAGQVAYGQEAAPPERPVQFQPYRVRLVVAFDSHELLGPKFQEQTRSELRRIAERTYGAVWQLEEDPQPGKYRPAILEGMDYSAASPLAGDADKLFLLSVRLSGARYLLSARELDVTTQVLSPALTGETYQRHLVAETVFALARDLVSPLLVLDDPMEGEISLAVRGGGFPVPDPAATLARSGDLFLPLLRFFDRDGKVQKIDFLPWSYLRVDELADGIASCTSLSALRTTFGRGASRRVQALAIRRPRLHDATTISLAASDATAAPLIGYDVRIVPKTDPTAESQGEELRDVSDRAGRVRVPVVPDQPIVWIYVYSGDALLARVPLAPGIHAEATLNIANDDDRMRVRRELALLEGRLVDAVARRSTKIAQIRTLGRAGKWPEVKAEMATLKALASVDTFVSAVNAVRVPALERANARRDRLAVSRIEKMCNNTLDLVRRFLEDDRISALEEELSELEKLDQKDQQTPEGAAAPASG